MRTSKPFALLIGILVAVSLACGTSSAPTQPAAQPPAQVVVQPTNPPPPTAEPTQEEAPAFFTEQFDVTGAPNWSYFLQNGNENQMNLSTENGKLIFDLQGANLWVYVTYEPWLYTDVQIEAQATNLGLNNNNVSLICRYTPERGWYEFNIANNGLYSILVYDQVNQRYETLFNGGSNAIKQGRDTNVYTAACEGNTLSLWINGQAVRQVEDKRFNLTEGQVGISVSSFDVTPILVQIEYFDIREP